jgi:hypothetical protein
VQSTPEKREASPNDSVLIPIHKRGILKKKVHSCRKSLTLTPPYKEMGKLYYPSRHPSTLNLNRLGPSKTIRWVRHCLKGCGRKRSKKIAAKLIYRAAPIVWSGLAFRTVPRASEALDLDNPGAMMGASHQAFNVLVLWQLCTAQ